MRDGVVLNMPADAAGRIARIVARGSRAHPRRDASTPPAVPRRRRRDAGVAQESALHIDSPRQWPHPA
ncbi:X-Pro dipeptidyl-peptidase [Burkholderia thailandensis]|nr:X-Pro dipeptidyl-peptidase [Burkholderia thailandensis]AOI54030.1 X-Pro dipeptidyl-peptidase [Burkholderia thailandensis]AOJ47455.1 X-Pro dipeptidyl-peptidase [Burkholderia thailandensis]AOJ58966.1 X-Pro dipeptidyl-peptidase [Burkholderia thailandensis]AVR06983.1 X-Pro dipeptidyl-peptidase [Burkholderia thailandensis]